jgi:hypothetical protein
MDRDLTIEEPLVVHPWLAQRRLRLGGLTCLFPDCLSWKVQGVCSDDCPFSR